MKRTSLLRVQQYLNHVGFLMVLISSIFCVSVGFGDTFFPSQMPSLSLSKTNQLVDIREDDRQQIINIDYHSDKDSVCLQINDNCLSLDDNHLGFFLSYHGSPYRNRIKRDLIDLRAHKDTPFKYVEKLFNQLRLFDKRLILFRTNTVDEIGGTTGVEFFLPPVDPAYYASMEKQEKERRYLLPPTISPRINYWSPLFDNTKVPPLHVEVNESGTLFYNKKQCLNQDDLFIKLKKDILNLKAREIDACIWLDVNQDASIQHFLATFVSIKNIYKEVWDAASLKQHGKTLEDLETREDRRLIRYSFPFHLLWMSKREYQFLKGLEEKNQLTAFIAEHSGE